MKLMDEDDDCDSLDQDGVQVISSGNGISHHVSMEKASADDVQVKVIEKASHIVVAYLHMVIESGSCIDGLASVNVNVNVSMRDIVSEEAYVIWIWIYSVTDCPSDLCGILVLGTTVF